MTETGSLERSYRTHALLCSALLLGCAVLTRPFAETGISDDFSYIRSAQLLAQTGHIIYNGVANPILGWQLYLGALFIKLFGFSFTVARVPILILSVATTYLLHRVMARFGLSPVSATLGTLTVMLSPAWFILTVTFMTDAAGLFSLVLCLYSCQRAVLARNDAAAIQWLCIAGLSDLVGGTARQIAWLGILVMVPATAWLLRRRKGVLLSGVLLWMTGIVAIAGCTHWFLAQPYTNPEKLVQNSSAHAAVANVARTMLRTLPSLPLLALPVMVIFTQRILRLRRSILALAVTSICIGSGLFLAASDLLLRKGLPPERFLPPWLGYNWSVYGVMQGQEIAGRPPVVMLPAFQIALALGVLICTVCVLAQLATVSPGKGQATPAYGFNQTALTLTQSAALLLPFSVAYFALLLPRATDSTASDRYLIPLVIVFVIALLRVAQNRQFVVLNGVSASTFFVFSAFAIAGTHDHFSFERARLQAAQQILNAGFPRISIEGGWEYDGWTQIVTQGHMGDIRIKSTDRKSGQVSIRVGGRQELCHNFIFPFVPAVQPRYQLSFTPQGCYAKSQFPPVAFHTWLPPYRQNIYIQKLD